MPPAETRCTSEDEGERSANIVILSPNACADVSGDREGYATN